jgi:hypothetical protein
MLSPLMRLVRARNDAVDHPGWLMLKCQAESGNQEPLVRFGQLSWGPFGDHTPCHTLNKTHVSEHNGSTKNTP